MIKRFTLRWSGIAEGALDFATRTRPLTYSELWEWCRRSPYMTSQSGLPNSLRLIRAVSPLDTAPTKNTTIWAGQYWRMHVVETVEAVDPEWACSIPLFLARAHVIIFGGDPQFVGEFAEHWGQIRDEPRTRRGLLLRPDGAP